MKIYIDIGTNRVNHNLLNKIKEHDLSVLIEPNIDRYEILKKELNSIKVILLNIAISDFNGHSKINIANRCSCSSLQEFTNTAYDNWVYDKFKIKKLETIKENNIIVSRLDTLLEKLNIKYVNFLHIDAQGEDLNIVKSLGRFVDNVKIIELECVAEGFQPLYKNQPSYQETIKYMKEINFLEIKREYHKFIARELDITFRNIKNEYYLL